jgi:alpha-L-arabinofuranosidase
VREDSRARLTKKSHTTSVSKGTRSLSARHPILAAIVFCAVHNVAHAQGGTTTIRVDASRVMNRISPWMYGSCIEDVNHEIYGGLYAQRIFGESFEEPPAGSPLAGWTAYGGQWSASNAELRVAPDAGAKLVDTGISFGDGTVECDIRLADSNGGNAGLILRVADPRTGADSWTGYEVSISAHDRTVHVSRHRNNWTPLKTVPAQVAAGRWHRLRADLEGARIRVVLDGSLVVDLVDPEPLKEGQVGVRTWNSGAAYRNLVLIAAGKRTAIPLSGDSATPSISGMWDPMRTGSALASYRWTAEGAYNGSHAQTVIHGGGSGTVGIVNRGLNRWGIPIRAGRHMRGRFYARSSDLRGPITVALQSADGITTYASHKLRLPRADGSWQKLDFALTPSGPHLPQPPPSQGGGLPAVRDVTASERVLDSGGRFVIGIDSTGSIDLDQVTLMESGSGLFKNLPFRADIGQKLVELGLTFLRYGGSMVNATEYRWKKMIGYRDRRPQYKGTWYPQSTNGFGIEEFLQYCEAARITPAFAINIWETPEDMADMVEYLNGPVSTPWGRKRAENGHPKPYGVRYIEIGNEEAIDGSKKWYADYLERFKLLERAMHAKDRGLQFVIAAWWRPEEPLVKQIAQELRDKAALWDVHVGGDDLREGANVDRVFTEMERLFGEWIPGSKLKAAVFEENGDRHDLQRALGHAYILNVTQRHGDFVLMDCPANCLQPLGQNDNGWNQGQVFFTPSQVWGMPPFYAQQMAAANHLPLRVQSEVQGAPGLDVTATRSENGKVLVLKVVNTGSSDRQARFDLAGFAKPDPKVTTWTLAGELTAVNTPEDPERIRTTKSGFTGAAEKFGYTFPPQSYTILRLTR